MKKNENKVYVVVDGNNTDNWDGGYNGFWVNEYPEEEFELFWENEITFSELVGLKRAEYVGHFYTKEEAWQKAKELGELEWL